MRDNVSRLLAVLALAMAAATAILFFRETQNSDAEKEVQLYLDVRKVVMDEYVDSKEGSELLQNALKGMLNNLDPYSQFYAGKEKEELEEDSSGKFVGIGVVIETSSTPLTVLFPQPDSPAEEAGIRVGDRITAIDGMSLEGLPIEMAREKIRGPEGSLVQLSLIRAENAKTESLTVRRQSLRSPTVARAQILDAEKGIGYLWISSFTQETVDEFDSAMESLQKQGLRSLILDLRFNPGGVLEASVDAVNRFLKEGIIVSTRGRNPRMNRVHRAEPKECRYGGTPLVVLINEESASASEVFAGAVQDHRLGVLLGTPSYGKGVVQSLKPVDEGNAIVKLTTSYYYTPANRNLEKKEHGTGLEPDYLIPVSRENEEAVHRSISRFDIPTKYQAQVELRRKRLNLNETPPADPQLDAALALLKGETPSRVLR